MARVLMLTRYGRLGASSRVRSFAYVPHLQQAGFDVEVAPLFDDDYVARLYDGRPRGAAKSVRAYLGRVKAILGARDVDLVWAEKELFPFLPPGVDLAFARRFPRFVLDLDDAVFHRYDLHKSALVRRVLGRRVDRLMRAADLVTVGSPYLAERARSAGARRVERLATTVDLDAYRRPADRPDDGRVRVGWIGTPRTARYLAPLESVFAEVARETGAWFTLIGAGPDALSGVPNTERRPWSEETEVAELARCDVGIMPLPDKPFERGKCAYKLVQFQALGVPVVASPVGMNVEVVGAGTSGRLAASPEEWRDALLALVNDASARAAMGAAGQARVASEASLQVTAPRLIQLLRETLGQGDDGPTSSPGPDVESQVALRAADAQDVRSSRSTSGAAR